MYISTYGAINKYEVGALIFYEFFRYEYGTPQDVISNPLLYRTPFVQSIGNKILFRIWIKIRWWTRMCMNRIPASTAHSVATCISGAELKR
jgi:hypothetical protein